MSLRLLLQKPEFTLPSSLSAGSIILSDFDCPVILWLWIIGHYSRNYHYILLIRPGRNYSSETLKDLRAEPSYLLSSGSWPLMDEDSACSLRSSHPLQSGEYHPDPGSGDCWLSLAHGLPGGTESAGMVTQRTYCEQSGLSPPQVGSWSKLQAWPDKGESYVCLTCINFYSVSFPWWSKKYLLIIIDTFGKYRKKIR